MDRRLRNGGGDDLHMELNMAILTRAQKALLNRTQVQPRDGKAFIMLYTANEDRVARNLEAKGFGYFVNNEERYNWLRRSDYDNSFYPPHPCDACGSRHVQTKGLIDTCLNCGAERA